MVHKTTIEGDSSNFEEAIEAMEASSSIVVNSYRTKHKAEFDPEKEEEETGGENEEGSDEKSKIDEPVAEPEIDMLKPPEWDVDNFDVLEYYSSPELDSSSDDDEVAMEHTRIYKRQIIESKVGPFFLFNKFMKLRW